MIAGESVTVYSLRSEIDSDQYTHLVPQRKNNITSLNYLMCYKLAIVTLLHRELCIRTMSFFIGKAFYLPVAADSGQLFIIQVFEFSQ